MTAPDRRQAQDDDGGIGPYIVVLLAGVIVVLGLAFYVVGYRDEIVAMLTQSPT